MSASPVTHTVNGIVTQANQNLNGVTGSQTINQNTTLQVNSATGNTGMFEGMASGQVSVNVNGLPVGTPGLVLGEAASVTITQ